MKFRLLFCHLRRIANLYYRRCWKNSQWIMQINFTYWVGSFRKGKLNTDCPSEMECDLWCTGRREIAEHSYVKGWPMKIKNQLNPVIHCKGRLWTGLNFLVMTFQGCSRCYCFYSLHWNPTRNLRLSYIRIKTWLCLEYWARSSLRFCFVCSFVCK